MKTLRIGPFTYKIRYVKAINGLHTESGDRVVYGECRPAHLDILVLKGMHPNYETDTIFHEALHALVDQTGFQMVPEEEELLVGALTPRLIELLQRNPKLVERILNKPLTRTATSGGPETTEGSNK